MTWIDRRIGISMAERGVPGGVLMVIRVLAGDTLANHTPATSVAYPPLAFLLKASAKSHSLIWGKVFVCFQTHWEITWEIVTTKRVTCLM